MIKSNFSCKFGNIKHHKETKKQAAAKTLHVPSVHICQQQLRLISRHLVLQNILKTEHYKNQDNPDIHLNKPEYLQWGDGSSHTQQQHIVD